MSIEKVNTVRVHYGPREVEDKSPSTPSTMGNIKELLVPVNFDNLPAFDATDATVLAIPAGAVIKSATLVVKEDFTSTSGTTTLDIGLTTVAGVVVDVDGLDAAVGADTLVAGTVVLGDGADIGTIPSLTDAVQVTVTPSVADLTAGEGVLHIEYIV